MSGSPAFDLNGKRIAVTGANTGIGQGIAVSLSRAGAEVVGVGRSSMAETEAAIPEGGGAFAAVECDLGDAAAVDWLVEDIWSDHGPLDGLVNNAGIIRRADAVEMAETDWNEVIDINLTVPFRLCREFARKVLAEDRRGKVVNIASLLSFQGGIRVVSYTASKHGIAGMTKTLANEWAARGINVNAIAPGYIVTNNTDALRADAKRSAEILARIPAGRWGEASDIGDTAVYLCAPASDYVHGAVIAVDGGWLAR